MTPEKRIEYLNETANKLREQFDCVQIFVSSDMGSSMDEYVVGQGNFFARYGQVQLWLKKMDEQERRQSQQQEDDDEETA